VAKDEISGVNGMGVLMVISVITVNGYWMGTMHVFTNSLFVVYVFNTELVPVAKCGDGDKQTGVYNVDAQSEYTVTNPVAAVGDNDTGNEVGQGVYDSSGKYNIGSSGEKYLAPLVFNVKAEARYIIRQPGVSNVCEKGDG
jgi:hypothetical protein